MPSLSDLKNLVRDISNAFVGTVADLYSNENDEEERDRLIRVLAKENRYMYLALLVLAAVVLSTLIS
jgi:DUF438 domain-containing protein